MNQVASAVKNNLDWRPQEVFQDFFYTDPLEILARRTVFQENKEYFTAYGGRASAKTWTVFDAVVVEASLRPVRVLCAREYQVSIDESIKEEIESAITNRGLDHFFTITKKEIVGLNGSKFIFKGIKNNIKNLKSICDVDILICEEADGISKNSWEKLLPSIRPRKAFGNRGLSPIIIIIFNPEDELDDTYQRFVVNPPPLSVVILANWRDNKYFPPHLERQRQHSLKTRPLKDHEHDWEGKPKSASDDVIIDREWVRAARFASKREEFTHTGDKVVAYDPSGQGKDNNAVVFADGNIVKMIDEWLKSDDLRKASYRAYDHSIENHAVKFVYDTCGGLGDGVSVFIDDKKDLAIDELNETINNKESTKQEKRNAVIAKDIEENKVIFPFDAGGSVVWSGDDIPGVGKTWGEQYSNPKAQAHGIVAQKLYNTYRFVKLGETDIDPDDMISIDIEDDFLFNKLVKELSCALWVKSGVNSKKKVEDKKAMEKRTGQKSPNISDGFIMCYAPQELQATAGTFDW